MSGNVNDIERREFKYLIDAPTAAAVRSAIRPFCELDPRAARNPRGIYTIESLYFDTAALGLYWANHHEQLDRIKVRVRGYAEVPGSPGVLRPLTGAGGGRFLYAASEVDPATRTVRRRRHRPSPTGFPCARAPASAL